jgi:hypothetical protein
MGTVELATVTSLPGWRETCHAEKNNTYFDFRQLKLCVHIDIYYISNRLCAIATPKHLKPLAPRKLHSHGRLRAGLAESLLS